MGITETGTGNGGASSTNSGGSGSSIGVTSGSSNAPGGSSSSGSGGSNIGSASVGEKRPEKRGTTTGARSTNKDLMQEHKKQKMQEWEKGGPKNDYYEQL